MPERGVKTAEPQNIYFLLRSIISAVWQNNNKEIAAVEMLFLWLYMPHLSFVLMVQYIGLQYLCLYEYQTPTAIKI